MKSGAGFCALHNRPATHYEELGTQGVRNAHTLQRPPTLLQPSMFESRGGAAPSGARKFGRRGAQESDSSHIWYSKYRICQTFVISKATLEAVVDIVGTLDKAARNAWALSGTASVCGVELTPARLRG